MIQDHSAERLTTMYADTLSASVHSLVPPCLEGGEIFYLLLPVYNFQQLVKGQLV